MLLGAQPPCRVSDPLWILGWHIILCLYLHEHFPTNCNAPPAYFTIAANAVPSIPTVVSIPTATTAGFAVSTVSTVSTAGATATIEAVLRLAPSWAAGASQCSYEYHIFTGIQRSKVH